MGYFGQRQRSYKPAGNVYRHVESVVKNVRLLSQLN